MSATTASKVAQPAGSRARQDAADLDGDHRNRRPALLLPPAGRAGPVAADHRRRDHQARRHAAFRRGHRRARLPHRAAVTAHLRRRPTNGKPTATRRTCRWPRRRAGSSSGSPRPREGWLQTPPPRPRTGRRKPAASSPTITTCTLRAWPASSCGHVSLPPSFVAGLLHAWNRTYCRPPLPDLELKKIFDRIARSELERLEREQ